MQVHWIHWMTSGPEQDRRGDRRQRSRSGLVLGSQPREELGGAAAFEGTPILAKKGRVSTAFVPSYNA